MAIECIFCGIIEGRIAADIVFESELTVAVADPRQHNPGHVLIPKTHIADVRDLDERTGSAVMNPLVRIARAVDHAFPNEGVTVGLPEAPGAHTRPARPTPCASGPCWHV
jgi:histidine triad (HIT) family protein